MAGFRARNKILASLSVLLLIGTAVYLRLWSIDYAVSSDDSELMRRQFDLANREAMDESAEWRLRFDEEAEKAVRCANELDQLKKSSLAGVDQTPEMLKKENSLLKIQIKALKQELEAQKLKCRS